MKTEEALGHTDVLCAHFRFRPEIAMRYVDYVKYQQRVEDFMSREGIENLSTHGYPEGLCEPHFSKGPCDCCGTHMGGDYYNCAGYNRETEEIQDGYNVCQDCVYYAEYRQLDDEQMMEVEDTGPAHSCASNHKEWAKKGFKDYGEFSECVEYVNQSEYGDGQLEDEWYYADDNDWTIYSGSFDNYNSPGADSYTYAERYASEEEYKKALVQWEEKEEYLPTDED